MKSKTVVTLLIAIAFGLVTAKIGFDLMSAKSRGATPVATAKIVVAQHDLKPGTLLTEADIATLTVPADFAVKESFQDGKELVGRALVSPIVKGQTLFEGLLATKGTMAGMQ